MIYKMKNSIQHYHWGDSEFLPDLMGEKNQSHTPWAELWMGAHQKSPSYVYVQNQWIELSRWIEEEREDLLGSKCWERFHMLPYLFKILSIQSPLSIQVHPSIPEAITGFEREESKGIDIESPQRNYKDKNHKPEILCALSDFWALKGFRSLDEILLLFDFAPEFVKTKLRTFLSLDQNQQLRKFYHWLMELSGEETELILNSTTQMKKQRKETYWVNELIKEYPGDISALSPLYLNLVHLQPGEALFQPAGEMHAYLKGNGVELMSNSDNVLRGGLTSKHMDIPELNSIVRFTPSKPELVKPEGFYFQEEIEDFRLGKALSSNGLKISTENQPLILLNLGDTFEVQDDLGSSLTIPRGQSLFADHHSSDLILIGKDLSVFWALPGKY